MIWKNRTLSTIGDLMNAISPIDTDEEAAEFMAAYRSAEGEEVADANIGYLSGYFSRDRMREIQQRFGVTHPVFGTDTPTAEEALAKGIEWGRRAREEV